MAAENGEPDRTAAPDDESRLYRFDTSVAHPARIWDHLLDGKDHFAAAHHCADMAVDVLASRFIAYEAIWRLASGLDATVELSLAKSWVSAAYQRVCALGHQVHGAIGFTAEHDLHYFTRHAMASALAFGDAGFHTERVAKNLGI